MFSSFVSCLVVVVVVAELVKRSTKNIKLLSVLCRVYRITRSMDPASSRSNQDHHHEDPRPEQPASDPTDTTNQPDYVWPPANDHEHPENPYLYGNGTYDGLEVAPEREKELVTVKADGTGSEGKRRQICGIPVIHFYALVAGIILLVVTGAVVGGVMGSRASKEAGSTLIPTPTSTFIATSTSSPSPTSSAAKLDTSTYWYITKEDQEALAKNVALTATSSTEEQIPPTLEVEESFHVSHKFTVSPKSWLVNQIRSGDL